MRTEWIWRFGFSQNSKSLAPLPPADRTCYLTAFLSPMILIARALVYLALMLPVFTFLLDRWVLRRRTDWPLMTILTWLACCAIVWLASIVLEQGLHDKMMSYDLNGDSAITGAEDTPSAQIGIDRWQHDTGRNFGPFLAVPIFAAWTAMVYLGLGLLHRPFRVVEEVDRR